jgi:hypothetical protein
MIKSWGEKPSCFKINPIKKSKSGETAGFMGKSISSEAEIWFIRMRIR